MFISNYYPVLADREDQRDLIYEVKDTELKERVDLRKWATHVENQVNLRSCTSEAVVGAYELLLKKQYPEKLVDLSVLFVYYNARILEGAKPDFDPGVYIKDALQSVKLQGICAESIWPYNLKQYSVVPTLASYEDAKKRRIKNYYRCSDFDSILNALSNEIPVVVSIKIYNQFNRIGWITSTIPELQPPKEGEEPIGGHSVVLVGYDSETERLVVRNSFGSTWGDNGYFYIPYSYARTEIMDAWVFDLDLKD